MIAASTSPPIRQFGPMVTPPRRLARNRCVPGPIQHGPSSRVNCVVDFYGPSDLTKSYGRSVDAAEVLPLFLGGDVEHERKRHILASPLFWVTPNAAPTLLIHGSEDKYVNYEQAGWMFQRLMESQVETELLPLVGAGHGFKGEDAKKAEAAMVAWLDRHLKK